MGCYACHGTVGQGGERGAGPKLAPQSVPVRSLRVPDAPRPAANMPRYPPESPAPTRDLADIYAYVTSIKPGPKAKDIPLLKAD